MEINKITNSKLKQNIADNIVKILLNNKLLDDSKLINLQIQYGYIFTKDDGVLEALMKVVSDNKTF